MPVCDEAIELIQHFEGCLKPIGPDLFAPYRDPVGIATIGYGSIWHLDGSPVQMSDAPITRAQAVELMEHEITLKCEPAIGRLITVRLHPLSKGALVSFCYNLGAGQLKVSNLRKAINERRWSDVPAEFAKWRLAGGKVLPGLVRRRAAEAEMFMRGVALQRTAVPENDNRISDWTTILQRAA